MTLSVCLIGIYNIDVCWELRLIICQIWTTRLKQLYLHSSLRTDPIYQTNNFKVIIRFIVAQLHINKFTSGIFYFHLHEQIPGQLLSIIISQCSLNYYTRDDKRKHCVH